MYCTLKMLKGIWFGVVLVTMLACAQQGGDTASVSGTTSVASLDCRNSTSGVTISWAAPTEFTDNSILDSSQIYGYKIYVGTESGNYSSIYSINDSAVSSCSVPASTAGTYYIAMKVVLDDGRESEYSSELIRSI